MAVSYTCVTELEVPSRKHRDRRQYPIRCRHRVFGAVWRTTGGRRCPGSETEGGIFNKGGSRKVRGSKFAGFPYSLQLEELKNKCLRCSFELNHFDENYSISLISGD